MIPSKQGKNEPKEQIENVAWCACARNAIQNNVLKIFKFLIQHKVENTYAY